MNSLNLRVILLLALVFFSQSFAQINSIQVNGGIFLPRAASSGETFQLQINHELNEEFQLYFYGGFANWGGYEIRYTLERSETQKFDFAVVEIQDGHKLIPFMFGVNYNLKSNKYFSSFISFEIGYSNLSYNIYDIESRINDNDEIYDYYPLRDTKTRITENLIDAGIGLGVNVPLTEEFELIGKYNFNFHLSSEHDGPQNNRNQFGFFNIGIAYYL